MEIDKSILLTYKTNTTYRLIDNKERGLMELNFPRQMLPFSKKTKQWRKECVTWASQKTFLITAL